MKNAAMIFLLLVLMSCNQDKEIQQLLHSEKPTEIMEGAYKAGTSGDKKYVPLLLKNANNPSASTALHWKGFTVYTEVMFALERIYKVRPPHSYDGVLVLPDSVNIKFYSALWHNMAKDR
jgi:hypothetical protein